MAWAKRKRLNCQDIKTIVNYFSRHQRSVATHAHNILIIVIVRDAVQIHRDMKAFDSQLQWR